jgi:hypothetical protein
MISRVNAAISSIECIYSRFLSKLKRRLGVSLTSRYTVLLHRADLDTKYHKVGDEGTDGRLWCKIVLPQSRCGRHAWSTGSLLPMRLWLLKEGVHVTTPGPSLRRRRLAINIFPRFDWGEDARITFAECRKIEPLRMTLKSKMQRVYAHIRAMDLLIRGPSMHVGHEA